MTRSLVLAVVFLLGACATANTEWVRTDTSAAQRDKDQKECQQLAYWQALDESQASHQLYPPFTGTGFGWGPPFHSVESPSYFMRGPREAEILDHCMRQRGYRLTRIARADW